MNRLLTSSDVARRGEVTREAVDYWERTGVLRPMMRTASGIRLYNEREVNRFLARRAQRARRTSPPTPSEGHVHSQ